MNSYRIIHYSGHDPVLKNYLSMIYSDFMRSLRFGNGWYRLIDSDRYYSMYKQIIDHLLAKKESVIRLAVLSDDLDVCLGWSLSEGPRIHYVFVKKPYRKQGIGTALMPLTFEMITHLTTIGQNIREKKFSHVKFDPFFN